MLSKLCLYLFVGGGLKGRHDSFTRFFVCSSLRRVLLLVAFALLGASSLLSLSGTGGVSLRFLRGAKDSKSTSSSSLLDDDMLAESEFVTAWTPFFTIRLLELWELIPVRVEKELNEVLTVFFGSCAGIWDGAGIQGLECFAGEGISTASTVRDLVGVDLREDLTEVRPELSGGASCNPSMPAICFLGDRRVGVEFPDVSCSSIGVSNRNLLGEAEISLRGRPRPRFTVLVSFWCSFCGDTGARRFAGDSVLSRVFARDELEEATMISSSSSCRGMRFFGIVNGLVLKKSVMTLGLLAISMRRLAY
jgi:hypothetical protein